MTRCVRSGFRALLVGVLLAAWPAAARAEGSFEELAAKAEPVQDLEPVVGPFLQVCGTSTSLEDFQCRAIRKRMQRRVASRLYRYVASAVAVSPYDGTRLRYWLKPLACLTCTKPLKLSWGLYGGKDTWFVTGKVPSAVRKGKHGFELVGIELTRHLARGAEAVPVPVGPSDTEAWERHVKPNLKVEFVFRVTGKTWTKGKHRGILVDILGYRVFNGCDGKVLASVPPSKGKGPVLASDSCPAAAPAARVARKPTKRIPYILSASVIRDVMAKVTPAVRECYETYQIPGLARVRITVRGSDGTVAKVTLMGKFRGTPTGKCIVDTLKNVIFPRFRKPSMRIVYPFILR